jgi:CBS domain-containing protein
MSLETELQTEQVSHLNLSGFSQVTSDTPVREVLARMRENSHDVCLIVDADQLLGIFTDRDVLRRVAAAPETWDEPVKAVMTPDPVTIGPESSAAEALRLMDNNHFRNLPVMTHDGTLLGNMTHHAIIEFLAARFPVEVLNLPPRPERFPRHVEGG